MIKFTFPVYRNKNRRWINEHLDQTVLIDSLYERIVAYKIHCTFFCEHEIHDVKEKFEAFDGASDALFWALGRTSLTLRGLFEYGKELSTAWYTSKRGRKRHSKQSCHPNLSLTFQLTFPDSFQLQSGKVSDKLVFVGARCHMPLEAIRNRHSPNV